MRNDGVLDALTTLLHADPDLADRNEIGAMIRHNTQIRGWVDAADIRFTRRLKELAGAGPVRSGRDGTHRRRTPLGQRSQSNRKP